MSRLSSTTLRIGDPAPPFSLPTLDGDRFHLGDAVRDGIALVVFVPGSWSPSARRQMTELAALHPSFDEAGIGIAMIVTQDAASLRRRLEATPPPFPVLADEHRAVARDYGVFRAVSWDGIGVTRPAAFVIDPEGAIRFLYVGERDSDAPDARSLLRLATWLRDELPQRLGEGEIDELEAAGFDGESVPLDGPKETAVVDLIESGPDAATPEGDEPVGDAEPVAVSDVEAADDAGGIAKPAAEEPEDLAKPAVGAGPGADANGDDPGESVARRLANDDSEPVHPGNGNGEVPRMPAAGTSADR